MNVDGRVHAGEPRYREDTGSIRWREDRTCDYCGSLDPLDVIRLLRTPGTKFSGTDKTTYKAYVNDHKFYYRHLRALTDEQLAEFDALSAKTFGIRWRREDGELRCRYPRTASFYGWQTWGTIGHDGEPVFDEHSPQAPPPEFWT